MYRGVYQTSWGNTWQSVIQKDGKRHYLGAFKNEESAARAYDRAALSLYGSTATLNFPMAEEGSAQMTESTQSTS
jgi:EREBP-like factor